MKLLDLNAETWQLPVSDLNFARGNHAHKYGPNSVPFSSTSSQSMELRSRLRGTMSSGTLGVDTAIKSQSAWSEQPGELKIPERSLAPKVNQL